MNADLSSDSSYKKVIDCIYANLDIFYLYQPGEIKDCSIIFCFAC